MNFPITNASFNLTQGCNLNCSYCFSSGKTAKRMPFDVARRGVDFLFRNVREADITDLAQGKRRIEVSFWGGEPLLEWKLLKEVVLYAEQRRYDIGVMFGGTTNGVLLTEDKFSFLDEHKIYFMVSLDGTQETHDKFRKMQGGLGSQAIIMRNMEKVIRKWPFYKVRMSPYAEGIHRFYQDVKYLVDHGMFNIMFSPVYESGWTERHWKIWEAECIKVVDLIAEKRAKGVRVEIEHFKSYMQVDRSNWPCGAGRFYVGIDVDGAIYPCHRFNKFSDTRSWKDKEVCIGHVDHGITRPEFRQKFTDFSPLSGCESCELFLSTPCHGGCYAVNFDFNQDIQKAPKDLCRYVKMQKIVSEYYKEKVGFEKLPGSRPCVCHNMCYLENTPDEVKDIDASGVQCQCNFANYMGALNSSLARPLQIKQITSQQVMELLTKIDKRLGKVEEYIVLKEGNKT